MKIVSWNLNHRTNELPIPHAALKFFALLEPDVIALNEFVDGPARRGFRANPSELGYKTANQPISAKRGKHNQVFIAAKHPIVMGDLQPPEQDDAATTNFLRAKNRRARP